MVAHIVIVGGGITGLSAAYYLEQYQKQYNVDFSYTLFEHQPRFGGKIITEKIGKFIVEGGPESLLTYKSHALDLCRACGLDKEFISMSPSSVPFYILRNKAWRPVSSTLYGIPTEIVPFLHSSILTSLGKFRVLLDYILPPSIQKADESLGNFIRRRMGGEALTYLCGPLLAGIYAADPNELSMQAAYPFLLDMEKRYGSLIRGMKERKKKQNSDSGRVNYQSPFITLRGGMYCLVEKILSFLQGNLFLQTPVHTVEKKDHHFIVSYGKRRKHFLKADAVIIATSSYQASTIIRPLNTSLATALSSIEHISTATISFAIHAKQWRRASCFLGNGFLIPRKEAYLITGLGCSSRKWDSRAPEEHILLRAYVGNNRQNIVNLSEENIVDRAWKEVCDLFGINGSPIFYKIYYWHKGNPQYNLGHLDCIASIKDALTSLPGILIGGSSYSGKGISDCIHDGKTLAMSSIMHLKKSLTSS